MPTLPPLCLAHLTAIDASPVELIGAALAGAYQGVSLRLASSVPGAVRVDLVRDRRNLEEVRAQLADTGLRVFEIETLAVGESIDLDEVRSVLDAGEALGASAAIAIGLDPDPSRLRDSLARISEEAARRSMRLTLEFVPYTKVRDLPTAARLLDGIPSSSAGIVIDALHLARSGGTPDDLRRLPPGSVALFQICDAPAEAPADGDLAREARSDRLFPGEGGLALKPLLRLLPPLSHMTLEIPVRAGAASSPAERARRAADHTRRFLANAWVPA